MRFRERINTVILVVLAFGLFFTTCKKKQAFEEENGQDALDVRFTQGECDKVIMDLNTVIMEQFLLRGKGSGGLEATHGSSTTACGLSLDTTLLPNGIVTMNYNNEPCQGRKRSGSVKFTIIGYPLTKWKHAGCTLRIEFLSYIATNLSTVDNIKITGTAYLMNESGNTWYELWYLNEPSVTYRMTGDGIRVVFNGGDFGKFSFDRRLTFTYKSPVTSCKVEGLGNTNNSSACENWGISRKSENFCSKVSTPYTWKTSCGPTAPLSGEVFIKINEKDYETKNVFGVNSYGDALNGGDSPCPYGFKTIWNRKNKTSSRLFTYF